MRSTIVLAACLLSSWAVAAPKVKDLPKKDPPTLVGEWISEHDNGGFIVLGHVISNPVIPSILGPREERLASGTMSYHEVVRGLRKQPAWSMASKGSPLVPQPMDQQQ